jgi:hypothetical protein
MKTIKINMKNIILFAVLFPGLMLAAPNDTKNERLSQTPAIDLYVDSALGLISEEDAAEKSKGFKKDFKSSMNLELEALKGDIYGVRQVTGKKFAELVSQMKKVSSSSSTTLIGKSQESGYLEVKIFLNKHSYVAILSAPLADLPEAIKILL